MAQPHAALSGAKRCGHSPTLPSARHYPRTDSGPPCPASGSSPPDPLSLQGRGNEGWVLVAWFVPLCGTLGQMDPLRRLSAAGGILGLKFRRQHVLHGFIVDFYYPSERIVIELEGNMHDTEAQR